MTDGFEVIRTTGDEIRSRPRVALCGDPRSAEFESVQRQLSSAMPSERVLFFCDLDSLSQSLADSPFPDLLIFVQTWSDEFPFRKVLELPGFAPGARALCCYGPWCVSDGRSRQDWPLALRVPVEDVKRALADEFDRLTGRSTQCPVPWTAGRDEIFAEIYGSDAIGYRSCAGLSGSNKELRMVTPDPALAGLWHDFLRSRSDLPQVESWILWDVDPWRDDVERAWKNSIGSAPQRRIAAWTGFTDTDFETQLRAKGATVVVSKLQPLQAVLAELSAVEKAGVSL